MASANSTVPTDLPCPNCGALRSSADSPCALCGYSNSKRTVADASERRNNRRFQFGISALLVCMGLSAIAFALISPFGDDFGKRLVAALGAGTIVALVGEFCYLCWILIEKSHGRLNDTAEIRRFKWLFPIAVLLPYAYSFFLPAAECPYHGHMSPGPSGTILGYEAFLVALLAMFGFFPCWLPNPALLLGACLMSGHPTVAAWLGVMATALAATTTLMLWNGVVNRLLPGYFIWTGSMVHLTFLSTVILWMRQREGESRAGPIVAAVLIGVGVIAVGAHEPDLPDGLSSDEVRLLNAMEDYTRRVIPLLERSVETMETHVIYGTKEIPMEQLPLYLEAQSLFLLHTKAEYIANPRQVPILYPSDLRKGVIGRLAGDLTITRQEEPWQYKVTEVVHYEIVDIVDNNNMIIKMAVASPPWTADERNREREVMVILVSGVSTNGLSKETGTELHQLFEVKGKRKYVTRSGETQVVVEISPFAIQDVKGVLRSLRKLEARDRRKRGRLLGQTQFLDDVGQNLVEVGAAFDVSADGSVVLGESGGHPFRWTPTWSILALGDAASTGQATVISGDGSFVLGGSSSLGGFIWTESAGMQCSACMTTLSTHMERMWEPGRYCGQAEYRPTQK